jgi:8-oxo-dGTP diphosphatase
VSLADARDLLTHDHDRDVLERFVRGPTLLGQVLLVRHASAGSRSRWEGEDKERPLDERGWAQAEQLVRPLSRFDVDRIITADYVRCRQTVEPLSEAIGVPIEEDPLFSERGYPAREPEAVHLVRKLGEELGSTVVCSQGDVIPDLLERLAAEDHVDLPESENIKKGSFFSLTFDGPRLFSAEYFPPPPVEP